MDFEHGAVRVQRAISRQNGKVVEAPLKTKNAYRTLPLSADAIDVLMQQRRKTGNSEWVFPSPTGGPMSPDSAVSYTHLHLALGKCFLRCSFIELAIPLTVWNGGFV